MSLYLSDETILVALLEKILKYDYSYIELPFNQPSKKCYSDQDGHEDSLTAI